jgi:hypothetical protein
LVGRLFRFKVIGGGGYEKLNSFFTKIGISHQVSCPHAHQQNGSTERKHRHIIEVGLSLLVGASMPLKLWDEAFHAAIFLINRTPSKVIYYQTPLERLYKIKPNYSTRRVFGCACWPNLRPYNQRKLDFHSKECIFLCYSNIHKGFKYFEVATGRVYISRDVVFDENIYPFSKLHSNAEAKLRAGILLLPVHLLPSNVNNIEEPSANCPNPRKEKSGTSSGVQITISPSTEAYGDLACQQPAIGTRGTNTEEDIPQGYVSTNDTKIGVDSPLRVVDPGEDSQGPTKPAVVEIAGSLCADPSQGRSQDHLCSQFLHRLLQHGGDLNILLLLWSSKINLNQFNAPSLISAKGSSVLMCTHMVQYAMVCLLPLVSPQVYQKL